MLKLFLRPIADSFLLILLALAGLVLLVSAACVQHSLSGYATDRDRRAFESSVRVAVLCPDGGIRIGSGVAISETHLLTARHVVLCDGHVPIGIAVKTRNGDAFVAELDRLVDLETDAARLVLVEPGKRFGSWVHLSRRPSEIGETVCTIVGAAVDSAIVRKCGDVSGRTPDGHVIVAIDVLPGNSGGPVFDRWGDVVGIVRGGDWREGRERYGLIVGGERIAVLGQ